MAVLNSRRGFFHLGTPESPHNIVVVSVAFVHVVRKEFPVIAALVAIIP
jgi:hypothetical protein